MVSGIPAAGADGTVAFDAGQSFRVPLHATPHRVRPHVFFDSVDLPEVAERVADPQLVLPRVPADGAVLGVGADPGGFEPLRVLPEGKKVVLGLVTTKLGELESADDLKRRIDEAARYVPLDDLCLSPQCGFSSTHHGNALSQDDQWRKLERVVEVARQVWG